MPFPTLAIRKRIENRLEPGKNSIDPAVVAAARKAADELHERVACLDKDGRDLLFCEARSQNGWLDEPVSSEQLRELYELLKMGPTSMNCSPARFVFICTDEGRERLQPALNPGNVDKTLSAPVVVIIAHDLEFYRQLPFLFPHTDARRFFAGKEEHSRETAIRNGTLQGAYLMLAARAVGLDCGPMSGFNNRMVDEEFFSGTTIRSNFLCGLGRGDSSRLFQRHPRFNFEQACEFA